MSAAAPALVRLPVWRARFVLAGFVAAFAVIAGRSLYLQAMHTEFLQEKGEARYSRSMGARVAGVGNCGRFRDADAAQRAFLAGGGPARDRYGVDPDGDGFACTWDPGPYRALR